MVKIFRVSLVHMVYSVADAQTPSTPIPFAEFRCFVFLRSKPTPVDEVRIKEKLRETIYETIRNPIFHTKEADEQGKLETKEDDETRLLNTLKWTGKPVITMVIDGFEVEELDWDDLVRRQETYFKRGKYGMNLQFNFIYRYVAFYDLDGTTKIYEYDEQDIQSLEEETIIRQIRTQITAYWILLEEYSKKFAESSRYYDILRQRLAKI